MTQDSSRDAIAESVRAPLAGDYGADVFLTPEQASRFLGGVHPRTRTRWARESVIPAYPMGEGKRRLWRFRREDLQAWMEERRSGPVPLEYDADRRKLIPATDASGRRIVQ
jgi:excisionase family DNA binding protein